MTTLQDVRFTLRTLRRAPGFTLIILLLLSLGIGLNTAVFTAVNGAVLRSLPYRDADRLVFVRENGPTAISRHMRAGIPDFHDWRAHSTSFAELAAFASTGFNVTRDGTAERVQAQVVSSNFARTLGVQPALGRFFSSEDDQPGAGQTVVVSHGFWRRALGGRRDIIGTAIALDTRPYTIIGVMPDTFVAPQPADVWVPMGFFAGPMLQWRANHMLEIVGRLHDGTTILQAQRELNTVAERIWASDRLMSAGWSVELTAMHDVLLGPTRPALLMMLAAVTAVMVIVWANVGSLLLARGAARRPEIAVRTALGASFSRLARQLLTESGVLAVTGAACGVVVAVVTTRMVERLASAHLGRFVSLHIDATVLVYVVAITIGTALVVSAAPLLQLARHRVSVARTRGPTTDPGRRVLMRLVTGEVAGSVTLLVLALLLVASFDRLMRADPGFVSERVLSFRVTLPPATYQGATARLAAYARIRERLAELPGVAAVGLASSVPFSGIGERRSNSLFVESRHADAATGQLRTDLDPNETPKADVRYVDAGFFLAMGMRLVRGGVLRTSADAESAPHAVINRTTAERVFPNTDPIGQRIAVGSDPSVWRTVVGIVEDVSNRGLRETSVEEVYLSHEHFPLTSMTFLVRTRNDAAGLERLVARELSALVPELPLYDVRTMRSRVEDSAGVQRLAAVVMRALAMLAFGLAVSGLYGVLTYLVARRTHELGVRMALGATRWNVMGLVLRQAMSVVGPGIGIGVVASVAAAQLIRGQLYGVGTVEPGVVAGVSIAMLVASTLAVLLPARRGASVDPVAALRSE